LLIYLREPNRVLNGTLENAFMDMVPHGFSGLRVDGALTGRKDLLPPKFTIGIGIVLGTDDVAKLIKQFFVFTGGG
jgi:hypothetical protein